MSKAVTLEMALERVEVIDGISQDAFGKIAAIPDIALMAMETKQGALAVEIYAELFRAVHSIADDAQNCINVEAETVGANYKDASFLVRADARQAAQTGRA